MSEMCHCQLLRQGDLQRASVGLSCSLLFLRAAWQNEWSSPETSLLSGLGSLVPTRPFQAQPQKDNAKEVPVLMATTPVLPKPDSPAKGHVAALATSGSRGELGCSARTISTWHSCPNWGNNNSNLDCVQNKLQNPFPPSLSHSQLGWVLKSQEISSSCLSLKKPNRELSF